MRHSSDNLTAWLRLLYPCPRHPLPRLRTTNHGLRRTTGRGKSNTDSLPALSTPRNQRVRATMGIKVDLFAQ